MTFKIEKVDLAHLKTAFKFKVELTLNLKNGNQTWGPPHV